jgi:hypothetical protein
MELKLTPKEKVTILKGVKERLLESDIWCICNAIYKASLDIDRCIPTILVQENFPELIKYKPANKSTTQSWFAYDEEGRHKRISIVDALIKEQEALIVDKEVYLKGDGTIETGKKIIDYLISIGGKDKNHLLGYYCTFYYFIDKNDDNLIVYSDPPSNYKELKLENIMKTKEQKKEELLNKIEECKELIKQLDEPENPYIPFVEDMTDTDFDSYLVKGDLYFAIQIGNKSVPENLRGRCLVVKNDYNWQFIDNPNKNTGYDKLLVCTEKK